MFCGAIGWHIDRLALLVVLLFVAPFSCLSVVNVTHGSANADTITLTPIKDSWITTVLETQNHGASDELEVYYYYEKFEYIEDNETRYALEDYSYPYLMFDLAHVPRDLVIDYASLGMYTTEVYSSIQVGTFLCPNNTWQENTVTWQNAPEAVQISSDKISISTEHIYYYWDVIDLVRTTFGIYNLTIVLKPMMSEEGFTGVYFGSREDVNNPPQLTINARHVSSANPSHKPDLTISDIIWSPTDPEENQQIAFQAYIKNLGNAPSLLDFQVVFYVDDSYVAYSEIGTMDVIYTVKSYPIVISPLSAGMHVVRATVDSARTIDESNEGNNELERQLVVKAAPPKLPDGPDLRITGVTWEPQNPSYEEQMKFYVYVENCGNEPSVPIFDVEVWVDDAYKGRAQLGTIEIGQVKRSNPIVTYPLSAGAHTVRAIVDSKNSVSETNETNNTYETGINVIPEYPPTAILLVFAVVAFVVVLLTKKHLSKMPENNSARLHDRFRSDLR